MIALLLTDAGSDTPQLVTDTAPRSPAAPSADQAAAAPPPTPAPAVEALPAPVPAVEAQPAPATTRTTVHPQVQEEGIAFVEGVVGQYEAAWPWVRDAWARSDVQFFDRRLPEPCSGAVACVRGRELLLTLRAVQEEEAVLHELGHVWNNTTSGDSWRAIQQGFADHYAGCYSSRARTPERLQEELLVDAMVIASGATIGDFNLGGYGYYEDSPWSDGFGGCLVDSSEPPPHLLSAIEEELFNCGFDVAAAQAVAEANAERESGSSFRLFLSDEEQRVNWWADLVPRLCADTAPVQGQTLEVLAAIVAQYEVPWPWVREAWEASAIQFVGDLAEVCPAGGLRLTRDLFGGRGAYADPPAVACVRGSQLMLAHATAQADADLLPEPLLQALARVWSNTAGDRWRPVRDAFAQHYAGCYSERQPTPEQLLEAVLADAMVIATGVISESLFEGYGYEVRTSSSEPFEGCDVLRYERPDDLMAILVAVLFRCLYDDDAAREAWAAAGGDTGAWGLPIFGGPEGKWQRIAAVTCGDVA